MKKSILISEEEKKMILSLYNLSFSLTKNTVTESVGVPDGIVRISELIYGKIKNNLFLNLNPNQTKYKINYTPNPPYTYSDKSIHNVMCNVLIKPMDVNEYGFGLSVNKENTTKIRNTNPDKPVVSFPPYDYGNLNITITFIVTEEWSVDDLKQFIESNENELISLMSHEMKHDYDYEKQKNIPLEKHSMYRGQIETLKLNLPPLQKLFKMLYYVSHTENLVRPTELYAKLKMNGITKSQFLNYLKKEYKILFEAQKFKTDELINDLKNEMGPINEILSNFMNVDEMSDDEKINEFLRLTYKQYVSNSLKEFKLRLLGVTLSIFYTEKMLDDKELEGNQKLSYDKFRNKVNKYINNPIEFYNNAEYDLNKTSTDVIKKLSKVYSLLPE